ncbi:MAG: hypothetical protein PHO32_03525, partial [Candidatus Cloacimonetes bacterium]|nr:hypothetical protein [Candidatus Cloacimonadota bacterium]
MKKLIILLIILLLCQFAFAIIDNKSYVNALQYYEMGNYIATKNSLDLIEAPDNQSPEFALLRGKVFLATGDFKQAHLWLAEYGKYSLGSEALAREDLLNMIYEASLYQEQSPIAVALGKLKGNINSSDPEYAPVITPDGRGMYYSSLRRDVFEQENIFYSTMSNNVWQEPTTVQALCTDKNESVGSISVDGQTAYLFGFYQNNNTNGDIYKSILSNDRWTKPAIIAEVSSPFYDLQPFVWKDQVMFLTSNRQGNNDNYDLFVSEFVGGYWTQPVSLGEAINTPYDEQSPFLSDDGKYLYFASRGFSSFGGNDIFVAERIGKSWTEWSTPQNMGPIINSVKDDRYFYISPDNQIAYLTSNRGGGMGQEDIYFIDLGLLQLVKEKIAMANAPKGEDGVIIDATPNNLGDVLKISGVVVDENNRPVKTDIVWTYVFYDSVYMRVIPTDEMGLFSFHLPITANGIAYEIDAPGYRKTEGSIEVPPDKNEVFVNITCVTDPASTTGGNIALNGKVLDENNKPVECIIRWAYVYNGELNEVLVETGKDGSFKLYIPKVTKVKYKIEEPKYAVREEILTLPEGIDSYSVIIRLVSLGNDIVLSGKVTDENDAPLVADVFWVYSKNNETVEYRVLSNVDGSYTVTLPRLARISYKVAKPNYMQISGDLDVPGNQREVTKDFRLVKLAEETVFQLENVQFEFAKAILT